MSGYMATILVADDDPDIAELVELHLAGEGFRVFKAYDGEEALNIFGREKIDLTILDVAGGGWDSGLQKDPGVQYDSGDHAECQGFRGG